MDSQLDRTQGCDAAFFHSQSSKSDVKVRKISIRSPYICRNAGHHFIEDKRFPSCL